MRKIFYPILFISFVLFNSVCEAQSPVIPDWKQNIKNSLNSINKSVSLKIDNQGNCYVLGTTWYPDSAKDIILVKFNQKGEEEWRRVYDNPTHGDDIPKSMCIDISGNIWVCGMSKTKPQNADFLVVKFTPDGIPLVDQLYNGKDNMFDCANAIAADKYGNVYALGYQTTLDSGINMLLIKYRNDGSIEWKRGYASRQMDVGNKIFIDDSSNVYICGTANNGPNSADILIQKYNPEGQKKWQLIYDGVNSKNDAGQFMSVDDSMNIYVSGFVNHSNSRADIPLVKITRNGRIIQDVYFNGQIADCGASNLLASKNYVYITAECNDYNISALSNFQLIFDKVGRQKFYINATEDVKIMNCLESGDNQLILGSKLIHPESTIIPYMASYDTSAMKWTYSDSTVFGLAYITQIELVGDNLFFLGDDTGDATGTISVFKYMLNPEAQKKKIQGKKVR
jgi:hypothetical protein